MTDVLVIRYQYFRDIPSYATIEPERLLVRYAEGRRVKKTHDSPIGRITEMEGTRTPLKGQVTVMFHEGRDHFGRDSLKGRGVLRAMRLLDHKDHVRVLAEADVERLAAYDAEIADLRERLHATQARRSEDLKRAWRRARPFGLGELEDRAKAELAEGRMAI